MPDGDGSRRVVCPVDRLPAGEMLSTSLGSLPVVVIRSPDGDLHALVDRCLHQGGPLSRGRLVDAVEGSEPGEYRSAPGQTVLKCPWHGWEYDVRTGGTLFDPRRRLRTVAVREEDGHIVIERAHRRG